MPQSRKKIVITGNQRQDVDVEVTARVVIQLARAWVGEEAGSSLVGCQEAAAGAAPLQQSSSHKGDLV